MMHCSNCGAKQAAGARFCYACGAKLVGPEVAPTQTGVQAAMPHAGPVGVGGWLLLLTLSLTLIQPVIWLFVANGIVTELLTGPRESPPEAAVMGVLALAVLALCFFAFYAGMQLWLRRADGPALARRYLRVVMWSVAGTALVQAVSDPNSAEEAFGTATKVLVSCGIWLWYLNRSKRVRATYGTTAPVERVS